MTKLERIQESITRRILSGALNEGDRLPSEEELATSYRVSVGTVQKALGRLAAALRDKSYRIVGQAPEGSDVVGRVAAWLSTLPQGAIARTPHAR